MNPKLFWGVKPCWRTPGTLVLAPMIFGRPRFCERNNSRHFSIVIFPLMVLTQQAIQRYSLCRIAREKDGMSNYYQHPALA